MARGGRQLTVRDVCNLLLSVDACLRDWRENVSTVCCILVELYGIQGGLNIAAYNGRSDVCRLLLTDRTLAADVNAFYTVALRHAIRGGHLDTVRMLIRNYGADPKFEDQMGIMERALVCAAENGFTDVLNELLDCGCIDPFYDSTCHNSVLKAAITRGRFDTVRSLFETHNIHERGKDIAATVRSALETLCRDRDAFSLRSSACPYYEGRSERSGQDAAAVLEYLVFYETVEQGKALMADEDRGAFLPLASQRGNVGAVAVLLGLDLSNEYAASHPPPAEDDGGSLHFAFDKGKECGVSSGFVRVRSTTHDSRFRAVIADADRALVKACASGHCGVADVLIRYSNADVHANEDEPLRKAAINGRTKCVDLLLGTHGANVHARYDEALIRAAYHGHLAVVRTLLDNHGADVHALDDQPLRLSVCSNKTHVVDALLNRYGANVRAKNDFVMRWLPFQSDARMLDLVKMAYDREEGRG